MKIFRKTLKLAVLAGFVLVVVLGAWFVYLARTRMPVLDGVVSHSSLKADVPVIRDNWGVPHIEADNETDAYFALGYVMAQDRLFQMELILRLARGELAEVAGPLAVPIDKIARSFQLLHKAEATIADKAALSAEAREAAKAFVAGINHCVATQPLPFEFAVLHIPPRTYTPADCLAVAGVLPITFAEALREDLLVTMLKEQHPGMDIDALFPGYSREVPVTVMESLAEAEAFLKQKAGRDAHGQSPHLSMNMGDRPSFLAALQSLSELFGTALGSNSWVVGPTKSKSGGAMLANDPHIAFTNPSVWYEAHLKYGDFETYGYYFALTPFALLGHNRNRGWAITMFENDDLDLYRETFKPDDPTKVMYKGAWTDVQTTTETIKVRFGREQKYTLRTTPHGPVMTDLFRVLEGYNGDDIALGWAPQHLPYTDAEALYRMGRARTYEEFAHAVGLITCPGVNISYADREGNIAWWAAGRIPIRPKHVNPKQVLDGASGKDEFLGFVPFEQNPHLKNPACGYIVTANNKSTVKPVGPVEDLQGYWEPDDRAARIKQLLDSKEKWSLEEMKVIQFDDTAYAAPAIVKTVAGILNPLEQAFIPLEKQALGALIHWDYRHNIESTGASIYRVLCEAVLRNALKDELGETCFRDYCTLGDHWNFFKYFIQDENSPYWDDVNTPAKETRRDIVLRAFKEAVATLKKLRGEDLHNWTWGSINTMEFKHPFGYLPFLGTIFNVGPFPASGGHQLVNNMIAAAGKPPYKVIEGPSTRRLIDFADPEHSFTILPTGNSGNFMSPNYADQSTMFMAGHYREPNLTKEQIESHKTHELRLKPQ